MVKRIICSVRDFDVFEDGIHIKLRVLAFDSNLGGGVADADAVIQATFPLVDIVNAVKQAALASGQAQIPAAGFTILDVFIPAYMN